MKIRSCGIIPFIRKEDHIEFLLIKHLDGHWSFPKGKKEFNESDLETAKREFSEETNITNFKIIDENIFIEKYSFIENGTEVNKEVVYFLGEVSNTDVKVQKEEVSEYIWTTYENALEVLTHEEAMQILKEAFVYLENSETNYLKFKNVNE